MKKERKSHITVSYIHFRATQTSSVQGTQLARLKENVKLSTPNERANSCCIYKERKTNNTQLFNAVVFILLVPLTIDLLISAKLILDCKTVQISI